MLKALVPIAVLAASMIAAPARPEEQSPPTVLRDIGRLADEYGNEATEAPRKREILGTLRDTPPGQVAKKLAPLIGDPARRPGALKLAAALRLQGLTNEAKRCLGTEDEDVAIRLLFVSQDGKAHKLLFDLWKEADPDEGRFGTLSDGFLRYPVAAPVVAAFKGVLEKPTDERRTAQAAAILKAQMRLPTEDPAAILADWTSLWTAYGLESRTFPMTGTPLLAAWPWQVRDGAPIGMNIRLEKGGILYMAPEDIPAGLQKGSFTLRMRVLVLDGEEAKIQVGMKSGEAGKIRGFFPVYSKGEWTVQTGELKQMAVPAKKGEWTTVTYEVTDQSTGSVRWDRHGKILIGEKTLVERGNFSGEFSEIAISAGSGRMIVGSLELIRK